jgi:hypothetical protein
MAPIACSNSTALAKTHRSSLRSPNNSNHSGANNYAHPAAHTIGFVHHNDTHCCADPPTVAAAIVATIIAPFHHQAYNRSHGPTSIATYHRTLH